MRAHSRNQIYADVPSDDDILKRRGIGSDFVYVTKHDLRRCAEEGSPPVRWRNPIT